ncbi:hypothetical protein DMH08_02815 [Actinomadura sp. WAC 06369]|nr:hypothetical protein DMH08_02815 [Actinomadura sp. WAC 06369]
MLLSTPDGTHVMWDANGDRIATFYADDRPGYWLVTLATGLEYTVMGPTTPEDVAATLLPS